MPRTTYFRVSLPSFGAIDPPLRMLSSPPKSTAPMGVEPPCDDDVLYSYAEGDKGSDREELVDMK